MKKNNLDKDMIFPILEENQLKLYQVSRKRGYYEYLEEIKNKYGYTDIIYNDTDFLDNHDKLLSLSSEGILYDVLDTEAFPMAGNYDPNSRYCTSISELRFYPKLYITLNSIFSTSNGNGIINMEPLVRYFKEKEAMDKGKFKTDSNKRLLMAKMNIHEQEESIETIIEIFNNLEEFLSIQFIRDYQLQENGVEFGEETLKEEDQQIQNFYYVGKRNSNARAFFKQVGTNSKQIEYNKQVIL